MYDIEKRSAILENAVGFVRLDAYIRSRNKMVALGYVYTLRKQTSRSLYAVRVEMPLALSPGGSDTSAHPCV